VEPITGKDLAEVTWDDLYEVMIALRTCLQNRLQFDEDLSIMIDQSPLLTSVSY
jgi:hypothetical protein